VHDTSTTVAELIKLVDDFVAERLWQRFHDPKNLSASIAIEAAELMEHFQWLRSDELDAVKQDRQKMAEIREEIADIAAYMLSFASVMGIDVSSALADKMQKNAGKYPVEEYRGRF
jgi:dCTP diphosphatase